MWSLDLPLSIFPSTLLSCLLRSFCRICICLYYIFDPSKSFLQHFGRGFDADASLYVDGEIAPLPVPQAALPPAPQPVPQLVQEEGLGETDVSRCLAKGWVVHVGMSMNNPVEYIPYAPGTIPYASRSQVKRPSTRDASASGSKSKRARSASPLISGSILIGEAIFLF